MTSTKLYCYLVIYTKDSPIEGTQFNNFYLDLQHCGANSKVNLKAFSLLLKEILNHLLIIPQRSSGKRWSEVSQCVLAFLGGELFHNVNSHPRNYLSGAQWCPFNKYSVQHMSKFGRPLYEEHYVKPSASPGTSPGTHIIQRFRGIQVSSINHF